MKTVLAACGLLVALVATPAFAGILFYGGDFNPGSVNADGLANEQDLTVSQAAVYTPFVVGGAGWNVTGLFTNNMMNITALSASWEIRSGVSAGNGGTLLFSGTGAPTVTDTGLFGSGLEVFQVEVTGLNINLSPGNYWMSVVPICLNADNATCGNGNRSFQANTDGTNAIGTPEPLNLSFFDSRFFNKTFENATVEAGVLTEFSAGVLGDAAGAVPEPGSLGLLGGGLLILAGIRRRR
jgi:hypothetical protein